MADREGNIAYIMLAAMPNRKNKTPFIGKRVLDGRTSDNDWDGYIPVKDLPRSINPTKGYIVTANNRQVPDHALFDYGTSPPSTGRAQRIDEIIRQKKDGNSTEKFKIEEVQAIQQDTVDVQARDVIPSLLTVVREQLPNLPPSKQNTVKGMLKHLDGWDGEFNMTNVGATVYSYWNLHFMRSLFHEQIPGTDDDSER